MGKAKAIIDKIIQDRSKGNPTLEKTTRTKLTLKGINPDKFTSSTPDDPAVITKLESLAKELGVVI
ncbi:hypothetical protein QTG56_22415 (plasmid) [Rossellomorea sp. AcN35-11]|nr:hypothetical protein [Rossellomorea aquimaris]WJV32128.1 hypothetical protein QTG56_22415 [Rossellomorea sp. AcN35-11]